MANEYDEQSTFEEDIEAILTTDSVQGDPPGFSGTLTGKINVVLFHIVNRTRWLKDTLAALNITVPNASTTVKGIAELATKSEAEAATDTTRITPPKRVLDLIRATIAQATETVRGTMMRANQSEAEGGTNNVKAMTSLRTKQQMQHSNAQATTSRRGTVKIATQQQVNTGTNETDYLTPKTLNESDAIQGIKAQATATISNENSSISFVVEENIVIGKLLFLSVRKTNAGDVNLGSSNAAWTLSGGAWRIYSINFFNESNDQVEQNRTFNTIQNSNSTTITHNNNLYMSQNDELRIIAVLDN